jgi:hypothetical protein
MVSERRLGALLVAGGCLPFAAGALMDGDGPGLPCPFREATGIPCPLCGASRAFALAARGDGEALRYNAAWVALALAAIATGLIALAASSLGRAPVTRSRAALAAPPRLAVALALLAAVPWAYAITERQAILGS